MTVRELPFSFDAQDGLRLAASIFESKPGPEVQAAVLITSATGVKRQYYDKFAMFLAANGVAVMTFDYRGVGESLPCRLRDFRGDIEEWGTLDLVGAMAALRSRHPRLPLLVVAHSVGGQILRFAEKLDQISGLLCVSAQHGYWGNWPLPYNLLFASLCHLAMPALSHLMGYFPARFLGLGEDLPKGIALGWARWARTSTYLDALPVGPRGVRGRAYSFSDDILAPKKACDRLCHAYAGVSWERRHIEPASLAVSSVGHFGFFQDRFRDSLWAQSLDWIRATRSVAS